MLNQKEMKHTRVGWVYKTKEKTFKKLKDYHVSLLKSGELKEGDKIQ